jgi:ribosomal protein S18 acetylase RimI-like enzyme
MPVRPQISFGIEFEFDIIDREGHIITHSARNPYRHISEWGCQDDPTAGCELRSPVFTSIEQAIESIKQQFTYWVTQLDGYVPYPYNRESRSLGQHIHLGRPRRRLNLQERIGISTHVAKVYPFLASLHAQPIPSHRGLTSSYCYPIYNVGFQLPVYDHYCEISHNAIGTIEFRLFDSNIPQVSLLCAWIMQEIARHGLRDCSDLNCERYRADRGNGLRHGIVGLDLPSYLREIRELTEINELPEIPAIKQLLYLACRYYMNAYNVKSTLRLDDYQYFKSMFLEPSEFLGNIINLEGLRERERVLDWIAQVERVQSIDELIGMAEATRQTVVTTLLERPEGIPVRVQVAVRGVTRSQVREALVSGRFGISRINEVQNMTVEQVANRIAELISRHGEGFTNGLDARSVIEAPQRFYVLHVYPTNEIVGCIAVHMRDGEISSAVVDRRFRRLGIARRLNEHVLGLNVPNLHAYVRIGNEPSLRMLQSIGFREVSRDDRSILLRRE